MSNSGFRAWLTRPASMAWSLIALIFFGAGVLFWGGFHTAMHVTDNIEFCVSCHSMAPAYEEYKTSSHYQNASGVKAICTDCHVPEPWDEYVIAKVKATRDLWAELRGTIDTPKKFEDKRLELAQRVWHEMEKTDSQTCRNCHAFDDMLVPAQAKDAQKQHPKAMDEGDTCISCHKGLVHQMPDMGSLAEAAYAEFEKTIGQIPDGTDMVHPLETQAYFLDAAGQTAAGKVLAGAPFELIGTDGEMANIRLNGWRQDDVARVMYAEAGKRILLASLKDDAQAAARVAGDPVTVTETGQIWTPIVLEGWLPMAGLTAETDGLWSYANALYIANCALCHAAPHLDEFDANQWSGQFKGMVDSSNLLKEEGRLVLTYLQLHGSDMGGH
ncbi:NapC/NirT family cytochrome c [Tropicimonas sp. TH_r6]|uniref:NapC/NirT family cytochrome c n=1 Tax=Tropicimonas sp. TH_r6 TaxID=3082085 RepID=UPI0029545E98|nr:NapC/NirT family cytochrome c [Tropicimonas sp. TH_r6]MDV7142956.1 NapC/NirT family cytochrome c [Tropicimonas sp. TH_r6]